MQVASPCLHNSAVGMRSVFDLAEHATIALNASLHFPGSVLSFCSMIIRTFAHSFIFVTHHTFAAISGFGSVHQKDVLGIKRSGSNGNSVRLLHLEFVLSHNIVTYDC